jgi:DNA mismatch endonuclease (patch repair protein)
MTARHDVLTTSQRSLMMSRIRGKGNKSTEIALAKVLRQNKISGWRRHRKLKIRTPKKQIQVTPDFLFVQARLAVFVDGCFWHGCPMHSSIPKGNKDFWSKKLLANKARDQAARVALRRDGWIVLRIWEHELDKPDDVVVKLNRLLCLHGTVQGKRLATT